ncbi:uncharacterized protein [Physcomitrium patens]|uniref:C2H2-type domain-containing protein n=1 Tax=Physcomitrium patens TaxID=3218 RepID=A0A2K1JUJ4_PHYPA|nr:zinc finger protein 10-like [Physcomitrium patens]PNR45203.1 hypothetical protein PHYPA_014974 [Physcomitrium patens]|eukprot:XP_024388201.1 zinc finger protein 10-like [Physcomitrella patens]
MGTRTLLLSDQEYLRGGSSWGAMHDPDVHESWTMPSNSSQYAQVGGGGGNTWSRRNAANNYESDSWEVRAFAEDASTSGQWPPRSYSCSFCHREFRTAQALGGHMNVHRRERAQANQPLQLRSGTSMDTEPPNSTSHCASNDWPTRSESHDVQYASQYRRHPFDYQSYDYRHAHSDSPQCYGETSSSYRSAYSLRSQAEASLRNPYHLPFESVDLELRLGQRHD